MQTAKSIPLVDYLVLGDEPHLVANECADCGARFFDRRNACAACGGTNFRKADVAVTGLLRAFTIVAQAAPGIEVPFVAGIVDCDGTTVRANVVHVTPDPAHVHAGMKVRLVTFPIGEDSEGTQAISFGFEPLEGAGDGQQQ
jgi:uncharacterized OB-fold protein